MNESDISHDKWVFIAEHCVEAKNNVDDAVAQSTNEIIAHTPHFTPPRLRLLLRAEAHHYPRKLCLSINACESIYFKSYRVSRRSEFECAASSTHSLSSSMDVNSKFSFYWDIGTYESTLGKYIIQRSECLEVRCIKTFINITCSSWQQQEDQLHLLRLFQLFVQSLWCQPIA